MPFALLVFGAILVTAGVRNTQGDLFRLLKNDFTGPNNFIFWFAAIMAIGAVGYVPKLKPISDAFLLLIVIVLFLHKRGFFGQLNQDLQSTQLGGAFALPSLPALPKLF